MDASVLEKVTRKTTGCMWPQNVNTTNIIPLIRPTFLIIISKNDLKRDFIRTETKTKGQ